MNRVYFTDRDLGKRFPEILRAAGMNVERHADHFAPDCPDETWLESIGQRGWIAITHDGRIRYKPNELAAVMQNRAALLVVIGNAPYPQLAEAFVATRSRIDAFVDAHQSPYIAKVYRPSVADLAGNAGVVGQVILWHPQPSANHR